MMFPYKEFGKMLEAQILQSKATKDFIDKFKFVLEQIVPPEWNDFEFVILEKDKITNGVTMCSPALVGSYFRDSDDGEVYIEINAKDKYITVDYDTVILVI